MKKSKKLMILGLSAATAAVAATGAVSSFAWFATNDTVTATGMSLKATTNEAYLQINTANSWTSTTSDFRTVAAMTASSTVSPTSPVNGIDGSNAKSLTAWDTVSQPKWVKNVSKSATIAKEDINDYEDVSSAANAIENDGSHTSANVYTLLNKFYLRIRPVDNTTVYPEFNKLTASIEWSNTTVPTDAIAKSMRVLIWNSTDSQGAIYSPVADADATTWTASWVAGSTNLLKTSTMKGDGQTGSVRTVSVYVYFDGEDKNCYTNNVVTASEYSVKVTFKGEKVNTGA